MIAVTFQDFVAAKKRLRAVWFPVAGIHGSSRHANSPSWD